MTTKTAAYTIDSTPHTAVVVCTAEDCNWRGLATSKPGAYRLVAAHLRHVHRDIKRAEYADRSARNYNRKVSQRTGDGSKVAS